MFLNSDKVLAMASAIFLACSLRSLPVVVGFAGISLPTARNTRPWSFSQIFAEETPSDISIVNDEEIQQVVGETSTVIDPEAARMKKEFLELANRTKQGFQATSSDKKRARELITNLSRYNPTKEPATPYYTKDSSGTTESSSSPTLAGKWTLVYTDAPDITGLDTSRNPLSTAKLGRIGQECNPPYIRNVIEWRRPDWAANLPFSGSEDSQILQKVVTSGEASPDKPLVVNLKAVGLELEAGATDDSGTSDVASLIQENGLLAGLLMSNPIDLKGPLSAPFGQFEILYLDDEFRVIKTYQNFLAANQRIKDGEEWF